MSHILCIVFINDQLVIPQPPPTSAHPAAPTHSSSVQLTLASLSQIWTPTSTTKHSELSLPTYPLHQPALEMLMGAHSSKWTISWPLPSKTSLPSPSRSLDASLAGCQQSCGSLLNTFGPICRLTPSHSCLTRRWWSCLHSCCHMSRELLEITPSCLKWLSLTVNVCINPSLWRKTWSGNAVFRSKT